MMRLLKRKLYFMKDGAWQMVQLGLYREILRNINLAVTKKSKLALIISKLKRFEVNQVEARQLILSVMSNSSYDKLHKNFVREVFHLHPDVFFEFFSDNQAWLDDTYYVGLYLSYVDRFASCENDSQQDVLDEALIQHLPDDINKSCLLSNIKMDSVVDKLSNLNAMLADYQLTPVQLKANEQFVVTNLTTDSLNGDLLSTESVTILVTAYNAEQTLAVCIESLLNQAWQNLQIIVINDASTDKTLEVAQSLAQKDNRVLVIDIPKNVGTFAAKSIGAKFAVGEFMTCQDSDDFAHPQKIERQIKPLLADDSLVATTSHWLRLDDHGKFYARQFYPFLRQNPASPLFRRQKVLQETGLWHLSKTGADSEFLERLKRVYGEKAIYAIKEPLTIASHRKESLMNSAEFGVHNRQSALNRLDYWECWQLWHMDNMLKNQPLYMPDIADQMQSAVFDMPNALVVNFDNLSYNLNYLAREEFL